MKEVSNEIVHTLKNHITQSAIELLDGNQLVSAVHKDGDAAPAETIESHRLGLHVVPRRRGTSVSCISMSLT